MYFRHFVWAGPQNASPEKLLELMKFLHKDDYKEKVLLVHFTSIQLNFAVLPMFSFVAPQNAAFMDRRIQV